MTVVMTPVAGKPGINASRRPLTLVPAFPAALTLTAPVVLVTATQGITSQVLPALKTRYILTAILAHRDLSYTFLLSVSFQYSSQ